MALTSIIGIVFSTLLVLWSIASQGGVSRILSFIDIGSFILVIGCSIATIITNYTFKELTVAAKATKVIFAPKPTPPEQIIDDLVKLAVKARKEGFIALGEEANKTRFHLLNLGVGLIADGTDLEVTREVLETAAATEVNQLALGEKLWREISIYAPMFGMMGTVIGLVIMLRSLSDPGSIGPAMALALLTTFYGIVIAGVLCLPIAGKIRNYIERVSLNTTLIIEGLMSIQAGDNSHVVHEKLKAYLLKRG